ncbi:MAG: NAD(P) transhydrogenase subunit alpha [SAR86 cluster bacterium]|uniref:proton-translocating NAD(P)(+) transhydrogenase n=1 Tax=SAR86 cluster bacterium TaxID=2030880 RepID=A0A937HZT0_9GAMM|nr:NAD(P) transhydrogenase subunit alpha [SAR86 cluster bacterium]
MNIFFPKEPEFETRVSLTLESAKKFLDKGLNISIEKSFAEHLGSSDKEFEDLGVKTLDRDAGFASAEIVCSVRNLTEDELDKINQNTLLVSFLDPFNEKSLVKKIKEKNISAISMELVPRITRAQKMDALSSQANLAGYSAVIIASQELQKALPMMMTAAGTISPSKVFVIGVGVAGLQAIATAKRLGAKVEAFDTRPVVEEQVKSLGARFVKIDIGETGETEQGYAKELTPEQIEMQREGMKKVCASSDIVITTAQVFGRPAPTLVTSEMVSAMSQGSVIVDMAVGTGGNVEGSVPNETIDLNGVKIVGNTNLPGELPYHSSQVYSSNIFNLIDEFWNGEEKQLNLDITDEILSNCLVSHGKEYINKTIKEIMN